MTHADPIRPTRERHRHDAITVPERDRANQQDRPARVETQTQLDRYERSKNITPEQAEAGRRIFADAYKLGLMGQPAKINYDRVNGSTGSDSEGITAARVRLANAQRALGDGLVPIVTWVCVDERAAGEWAKEQGEHPAAGIAVLRLALTALAKHYGIVK